ncbi:DUF881 domain-containing protein [Brachybacterium sp. DNPG3]
MDDEQHPGPDAAADASADAVDAGDAEETADAGDAGDKADAADVDAADVDAAADETPGDPPLRSRLTGGLGVGVIMVLCGVLFVTTARLAGGASLRNDSGDVATALQERATSIEQLNEEAARTRAEIDELTAEGSDDATEERLAQVADVVGLTEVTGPALQITLTDAPTSALGSKDGIEPDDLVVHQQDMEAYINALWAGGAEAMMLQDQRVVNGSAFRCAGNTLLLEGRVYSPPFTITAVGPTDEMMASLDEASGVRIYREWVDYVGLGEKVVTLDETTLPAFEGSLTVDIAKAG